MKNFKFPEGMFPFVIHAATEASARQAAEEPLEMLSTILAGTERTLEFAATHGAVRFLLTSSGAVYGRQPSSITHLPESYAGAPDPLDPSSVYAEGKRAAELMCSLYQRKAGIECAIARCWAFCGPHLPLDAHFAIGNFIGNVLRKEPIPFRATARRGVPTSMALISQSGCGRCSFALRADADQRGFR